MLMKVSEIRIMRAFRIPRNKFQASFQLQTFSSLLEKGHVSYC